MRIFVELDALNWLPDWVGLNETNPAELTRRIEHARRGDAWVVGGSYTRFAQQTFWARLDTVIWLDLPTPLLVWRMLRRAWRRWRTRELLWASNTEKFWPHFAFWRKDDSLIYWIVTQRCPPARGDTRCHDRPALGAHSLRSADLGPCSRGIRYERRGRAAQVSPGLRPKQARTVAVSFHFSVAANSWSSDLPDRLIDSRARRIRKSLVTCR